MKKINVAIVGYGRSGRDIHGAYFLRDKSLFNVVAVVDELEERRNMAAAEHACDVYADYQELLKRDDVGLIVNASFSHCHHPLTKTLLSHGKNVIVEKPFAIKAQDCRELIATASSSGAMLSVFQQSHFAPYYKKIKEIINSGVLGRLIQISISFSGFARRWDWQCCHRLGGGNLRNTGPHPFEQALDLLGNPSPEDIEIVSRLDRVNTSGDAEDYVKVLLLAPEKPLVDIEISSCDAYSTNLYKIHAANGSLRADMGNVEWKYFIPENEILRPLNLSPLSKPDGTPSYCTESLTWHEHRESLKGTAFDSAVREYYQNIYDHLIHDKALIILPENIAKQIAIMEEIHRANPMSTFC